MVRGGVGGMVWGGGRDGEGVGWHGEGGQSELEAKVVMTRVFTNGLQIVCGDV